MAAVATTTANGVAGVLGVTGGAKRQRKAAAQPKGPSAAQRARAHAAKLAERWARVYTGTAIALSAGLNGYSSVVGSGATGLVAQVTAAGIGAIIPVLVWMLGTVTAWTYRAGWRRLALVIAAIAACGLALSVCHVAEAVAAWTGATLLLSTLLAVVIDCGLVASEAAAVLVSSVE